MKVLFWSVTGLLLCVLTLYGATASANTLREDYKNLEIKRRNIELTRSQYEARFREMSARRNKLNLALYQCVSANWKAEWEEKMTQAKHVSELLEQERLKLVNLRIELDKTRNHLETLRAEIEERYKNSRNQAYEAEFRGYMDNLNAQYFQRIEVELFVGYIQYLAGVEEHLIFLQTSLNECQQ